MLHRYTGKNTIVFFFCFFPPFVVFFFFLNYSFILLRCNLSCYVLYIVHISIYVHLRLRDKYIPLNHYTTIAVWNWKLAAPTGSERVSMLTVLGPISWITLHPQWHTNRWMKCITRYIVSISRYTIIITNYMLSYYPICYLLNGYKIV